MTKVVLIRHGRSTANAGALLAGRMPGVELDARGQAQAKALAETFRGVRFAAAYTSPIHRCMETARLAGFPEATPVEGLSECDYGVWTGAKLADLVTESLWREIQLKPSAVSFPGGEAMLEMAERCLAALTYILDRHSANEVVAVFSHGDPIKAILAHAMAIAFDEFQRIHVNPAGISIVEFCSPKPRVLCLNASGDVAHLLGATAGPLPGGGDCDFAKDSPNQS